MLADASERRFRTARQPETIEYTPRAGKNKGVKFTVTKKPKPGRA